jgi:hypothetical protein
MGRWGAAVTLLAAGLGLPGLSGEPSARADTPSSSASCDIKGTAVMPVGLLIYDKSDGGTALAKFTGAATPLAASDFFANGDPRVRVKTATGGGGFRIEGWVDADKLPLYTARDVPVVAGHLWIAGHYQVALVSASSGQLRIKRAVGSPFSQTFTATAPCSSLSLNGGVPAGFTPAGNARAYVAKKDVELYDSGDSGRRLVTILTPDSSSDGVLLWSTEKKNGWVHVEHHSDVVIDAWAKASELKALPEGETMDQQAPATTSRSGASLKVAANPTLVKAPKELAIRSSGSDKATVVGHVEPGTETYVLDIVAGWANVLPKSLHVVPPGDGGFWVKASELGVKP